MPGGAVLGFNGTWKRDNTQYEGIAAPPPAAVCSGPANHAYERCKTV